jgi:hypothetical protein
MTQGALFLARSVATKQSPRKVAGRCDSDSAGGRLLVAALLAMTDGVLAEKTARSMQAATGKRLAGIVANLRSPAGHRGSIMPA